MLGISHSQSGKRNVVQHSRIQIITDMGIGRAAAGSLTLMAFPPCSIPIQWNIPCSPPDSIDKLAWPAGWLVGHWPRPFRDLLG